MSGQKVIECCGARWDGKRLENCPRCGRSFAAPHGSPDQWRELALASMKVCHYRPHPREWWDDEMKDEALKEYETAMRTVRELKAKLGLENAPDQRPGAKT